MSKNKAVCLLGTPRRHPRADGVNVVHFYIHTIIHSPKCKCHALCVFCYNSSEREGHFPPAAAPVPYSNHVCSSIEGPANLPNLVGLLTLHTVLPEVIFSGPFVHVRSHPCPLRFAFCKWFFAKCLCIDFVMCTGTLAISFISFLFMSYLTLSSQRFMFVLCRSFVFCKKNIFVTYFTSVYICGFQTKFGLLPNLKASSHIRALQFPVCFSPVLQ